ncbi:hypothetical protein BaRGS_00024172 [Batillaria attramentaria]|uniref:Uncharacterized protein n=1 Tax=Batillaria attramentaria TaxID=370345 RepID=A0ABD0KBS1_9CAEN
MVARPIALVAGTLVMPGSLQSVALFTIVAAAELLLNEKIFLCPCDRGLGTLYGLSFLLVPAVILFLADFPWKLFRTCPSPGILCTVSRRPVGLAVTWIIVGSLQRKYVDCILEVQEPDCQKAGKNGDVCCEKSVPSSWFQLMGLYIWLVIIIVAFDRSSALEMTTRFEIEDKLEQENLRKKIKYGTTRLVIEEELNLDELQSLQPGLNLRTFATLQSEELLYPSVLAYLREEDLPALDISAAQRCLLRGFIQTVRQYPQKLKQFAGGRQKTIKREANAV